MKKSLFLLLAVLSLAACTNHSYKINGNFADGLVADSTVVYMQQRVVREWVVLDSAVVSGGQFSFEGQVEEPFFAYVTYTTAGGQRRFADMIVEPGTLEISIDAKQIHRAGVPQNDLLQSFYDKEDALFATYETKYEEQQSQPQTPERQAAWEIYVDSLQNAAIAQTVDFVLANANTLPANVIFTTRYYNMSIEQKDAIIAALDENSRAYDRIPLIIETLEIERRTAIGQPYTDIALPDTTGQELALSSVVGTADYVLVDFWASWCGPCRASFPELTALYSKYTGTNKFEIFGVSLDNKADDWKGAIASEGLSWKHVSDLKGWECAGAQTYGVNAIPCTVLINKDGKIVGRNLSIQEIEQFITGATK